MKKYLLMLLAAVTVGLVFTACGKDEEEEKPQPEPEPTPEVIAFENYASTIGKTVQQMLQEFGEPAMNFGSIYFYTFEEGNVEGLTISVNPENNQIYAIVEALKENVYTEEQLKAYFDSKYEFYGKSVIPADEEEGTPAQNTYTYGNTEDPEEATLFINVIGNSSVTYSNPKNQPEEQPLASYFDEMSPEEVLQALLGQPISEVLEEYPDAFMDMAGMYMTACENELFTGFALIGDESGANVASVFFFFDDGLEESAILDYFRSNGWTVTQTEDVDEEGNALFYITKGNYILFYQGWMGTASIAE